MDTDGMTVAAADPTTSFQTALKAYARSCQGSVEELRILAALATHNNTAGTAGCENFLEVWRVAQQPEDLTRARYIAMNRGDPLTEAKCFVRISRFTGDSQDYTEAFMRLRRMGSIKERCAVLKELLEQLMLAAAADRNVEEKPNGTSPAPLSQEGLASLFAQLDRHQSDWADKLRRRFRAADPPIPC